MIESLKKLVGKLPVIRPLLEDRAALRTRNAELQGELQRLQQTALDKDESLHAANHRLQHELDASNGQIEELRRLQGFVPPAHFYSPIPDFEAASEWASAAFDSAGSKVSGVELNEDAQLALVESFVPYYGNMDFSAGKQPGVRYHYDNPAYSYSDAIMLHCMIRHARPARIIEIGSGYSSCMMLDTNELYFEDKIDLTFIEPYPELLVSLLEDTDLNRVRILQTPVQEVGLAEFSRLQANDILFIDSTHVSRTGSDVNRIFFDILPVLAEGVYVHFHDIFFPFEYPPEWLKEGRAWNEAYMLRTFLQFNSGFEVTLMNTFLHRRHPDFFEQHMPLTLHNTGGSIWLRKTTSAQTNE